LKKVLPGIIPSFLAIFSTSLTGSEPGDKMKKMGMLASASTLITLSRRAVKASF
jgi:hypothetical protein